MARACVRLLAAKASNATSRPLKPTAAPAKNGTREDSRFDDEDPRDEGQ
jgi:hypothetical protein